jgi:hypothetical protein
MDDSGLPTCYNFATLNEFLNTIALDDRNNSIRRQQGGAHALHRAKARAGASFRNAGVLAPPTGYALPIDTKAKDEMLMLFIDSEGSGGTWRRGARCTGSFWLSSQRWQFFPHLRSQHRRCDIRRDGESGAVGCHHLASVTDPGEFATECRSRPTLSLTPIWEQCRATLWLVDFSVRTSRSMVLEPGRHAPPRSVWCPLMAPSRVRSRMVCSASTLVPSRPARTWVVAFSSSTCFSMSCSLVAAGVFRLDHVLVLNRAVLQRSPPRPCRLWPFLVLSSVLGCRVF